MGHLGKGGQRKDFSFVLVLKKNGKMDGDFRDLVSLILRRSKKAGLIDDDFAKEVLIRFDEFCDQGDYTLFKLPFEGNMPFEKRALYDKVKKDIQSLIEKDPKYEGFDLFTTVRYRLNAEEKKIPIDFDKILLELYPQITGGLVVPHTPKALPIIDKTVLNDISWFVTFEFLYSFTETELTIDEFLGKLKEAAGYLKKQYSPASERFSRLKKILGRSPELKEATGHLKERCFPDLDLKDIRRRYAKALEDFERHLKEATALAAKEIPDAITPKTAKGLPKQIAKEIPKIYMFYASSFSIPLSLFKKIQGDLVKNLNIKGPKLDYEVTLTTNPWEGASYGCFIQPKL
ncbi:MAG: hypothetical protein QW356_05900 [Candidatus Hadarchaeales archaeon]